MFLCSQIMTQMMVCIKNISCITIYLNQQSIISVKFLLSFLFMDNSCYLVPISLCRKLGKCSKTGRRDTWEMPHFCSFQSDATGFFFFMSQIPSCSLSSCLPQVKLLNFQGAEQPVSGICLTEIAHHWELRGIIWRGID